MSVSYDYYRIFYYVARYQSFSRAAEVLMSSQPNITRCMNNLEQALGCRLFHRSNRGVSLTREGELLFEHVRVAQEQLETAEMLLKEEQLLHSGVVQIGATETALNIFLLEKLKLFQQKYPGIRLRLENQTAPQALEALEQGRVDLAVVSMPAQTKPAAGQTVLLAFEEILIGGERFRDLAQRPLSLEQLRELPLIMLERQTMTYGLYQRWFVNHGLLLEPDIEAATADQILPLVVGGLGLAFLPRAMAEEALRRGEVFRIPLREEIPRRNIVLAQSGRPLSPAARELVRLIEE